MNNEKNGKPIIAVDLTPVKPGGINGGAKILALDLLKGFQDTAPDLNFQILTAYWNHEELEVLDGQNMERRCLLKPPDRKESKPRLPVFQSRTGRYIERQVKRVARKIRSLVRRKTQMKNMDFNLLFCPFTAPNFAQPGIPVLSVIHDLQHMEFPHFFDQNEIDVRNEFYSELVRKADRVVCVSKHVRGRVIDLLKIEPGKTRVIYNAVHEGLAEAPVPNDDISFGAQHLIPGSYMVYPANFWPHKNHRMLLAAFGMYAAGHPDDPVSLVLSGALDNGMKELSGIADRMGLSQRVLFPGYLDRNAFTSVMQGARFLVFPSLYEGFGIPVIEAMAAGVPVIASRAASLPEVCGDAALFFDPRKPDEIVRCMEQVTNDPVLRATLTRKGARRASFFSYSEMVQRYVRNIRELIKEGSAGKEGA